MDKDTSEVIEILNVILAKMATKDDIAEVRAEMATKRELTGLRKETLEGFSALRGEMREGFLDVRSEVKGIRERLDALKSAVQNISGYAKEIDHLIERVSAIETHLGIERKIAA